MSKILYYITIKELNTSKTTTKKVTTPKKVTNARKKTKKKQGGPLKPPKGTKDYGPLETKIREQVVSQIRSVFRKHGGTGLETPVFELKQTLTDKYGEDSKLIFDLADQGGEICALRYDLTVPFARYLSCQDNNIQMKRYSIGRVYRRDQPAMNRGRFREFYQCDFDIAGQYDGMVADAEIIKIACEALEAVDLGVDFLIKLNHRSLLDGIFEVCGVPPSKFREICSAVDKLDKMSWKQVKHEMCEVKGLKTEVADRIGEFVLLKGAPKALLAKLVGQTSSSDASSSSTPSVDLHKSKYVKKAIDDLTLLFDYLEVYEIDNKVSFDLSLARGLDYYTGVIFEAVLIDKKLELGSIAGGGRYDNLVKDFKKRGNGVPCVGFSLGIERIFGIIQRRYAKNKRAGAASDSIALIASFPCKNAQQMTLERMRLLNELWNAGLPAELFSKKNPKVKQQLTYAEKCDIPFVVFVGDEELSTNTITLKQMNLPSSDPEKQKKLPREKLIEFLKKYDLTNQ